VLSECLATVPFKLVLVLFLSVQVARREIGVLTTNKCSNRFVKRVLYLTAFFSDNLLNGQFTLPVYVCDRRYFYFLPPSVCDAFVTVLLISCQFASHPKPWSLFIDVFDTHIFNPALSLFLGCTRSSLPRTRSAPSNMSGNPSITAPWITLVSEETQFYRKSVPVLVSYRPLFRTNQFFFLWQIIILHIKTPLPHPFKGSEPILPVVYDHVYKNMGCLVLELLILFEHISRVLLSQFL
jgi:hypothetical protein